MKIVLLAGGGHARSVINCLSEEGQHDVYGIVDSSSELANQNICGIPYIGGDEILNELKSKSVEGYIVTLGSVGNNPTRLILYELGLDSLLTPVNTIHPNTNISKHSSIGQGCVVLSGAIINAFATIGNNAIINTGAIIEHDCNIEDHVHIASGACLAGNVRVGNGAHVGAGAVVRQGVSIGNNVVVGVGAVVINDVASGCVVAGNPARVLEVT